MDCNSYTVKEYDENVDTSHVLTSEKSDYKFREYLKFYANGVTF